MKKKVLCIITMIFMFTVCFPATVAAEKSFKENTKTAWEKTKDGFKDAGKDIKKSFKKEKDKAAEKVKKDSSDLKKEIKKKNKDKD